MERGSARALQEKLAPVGADRIVAAFGAAGAPAPIGCGRLLVTAAAEMEVTMTHDDGRGPHAQGPMEDRSEHSDALIEAAERMTAAAVAGELAHELGTPLNVILGRATLGLRDVSDLEQLQHHLRVVIEQTHRMTGILRIALGHLRPPLPCATHGVLVSDLVARVMRRISFLAASRGVTVVAADVAPLAVRGEEAALELALVHLVGARLEVLPPGATLCLRVAKAHASPGYMAGDVPSVQMTIEDDGPAFGEAREDLQTASSFLQGPRLRSDTLPIAVCREVLRQHGGRLEMSSGAQGTSVQVFLPEGES
ncbi:MAG: sensor histidine kinase [Myxococcota bacterium]